MNAHEATHSPAHRRIVVYGPSGSGKTTLSRRIAAIRSLRLIELDSIYHRPNWEPAPDDEFTAQVLGLLDGSPDGWVVDGNYRVIRPLVLPRADTIVRLRFPFPTVYWRLLKRTLTRSWTNAELWNGNRESFRLAFFSRESILLWGISHWQAHHRNIEAALRDIPHPGQVIELHSDAAVKRFLDELTRLSPPART
jgi:hypothetical protein